MDLGGWGWQLPGWGEEPLPSMAPQRHQKSPFYPGGGDSIVNPEAFQEVIGQPWTSSPGVRVEVGGRQDLTGSQRCPFTSSPWVQRWGQDGGGGW